MEAFKKRALGSQPTRALLNEIDTHRVGLETTLAAVIVIWCQDGSIAISARDHLDTALRKSIKEINDLKEVLNITTKGVGSVTVISAKQPSEDWSLERTAHTDVSNRRRIY
jgi:hypothetical protein